MINKQSIWFLTLFGLVLVLGVYYITMPSDILQSMNNVDVTDNSSITVSENDVLAALRVEHDEETLNAMQELEETLTSEQIKNLVEFGTLTKPEVKVEETTEEIVEETETTETNSTVE